MSVKPSEVRPVAESTRPRVGHGFFPSSARDWSHCMIHVCSHDPYPRPGVEKHKLRPQAVSGFQVATATTDRGSLQHARHPRRGQSAHDMHFTAVRGAVPRVYPERRRRRSERAHFRREVFPVSEPSTRFHGESGWWNGMRMGRRMATATHSENDAV